MASSSLNLEGQKKLRVMSLDYIKNSLIKKTTSSTNKNVCCGCRKEVDLNLDEDIVVVEPTSTNNVNNCDSVNNSGEYKNRICKECGKTVTIKHKSGFLKVLRKRLRRRSNCTDTADSLNKCVASNKQKGNSTYTNDFNVNNCSRSNQHHDDEMQNPSKCNFHKDKTPSNKSCCNHLLDSFEVESLSDSNAQSLKNDHIGKLPDNNLVSNCDNDVYSVNNVDDVNSKDVTNKTIQNSVVPASPKTRSLTCELLKLSKYGWYWGPITREEAEEKLQGQPDGAFLVRDSSADHYLLSLSFRSSGKLLHCRIEYSQGLFSFYNHPEQEGFASIGELIDHSVSYSQSAVFCYSRPRSPGHPAFPVRLTKPVSRFTQVRSLQYLCRFVIRQYIRVDNIENLPLPNVIKGYIQEGHY